MDIILGIDKPLTSQEVIRNYNPIVALICLKNADGHEAVMGIFDPGFADTIERYYGTPIERDSVSSLTKILSGTAPVFDFQPQLISVDWGDNWIFSPQQLTQLRVDYEDKPIVVESTGTYSDYSLINLCQKNTHVSFKGLKKFNQPHGAPDEDEITGQFNAHTGQADGLWVRIFRRVQSPEPLQMAQAIFNNGNIIAGSLQIGDTPCDDAYTPARLPEKFNGEPRFTEPYFPSLLNAAERQIRLRLDPNLRTTEKQHLDDAFRHQAEKDELVRRSLLESEKAKYLSRHHGKDVRRALESSWSPIAWFLGIKFPNKKDRVAFIDEIVDEAVRERHLKLATIYAKDRTAQYRHFDVLHATQITELEGTISPYAKRVFNAILESDRRQTAPKFKLG